MRTAGLHISQAYVAGVLLVYSGRGWVKIDEVIRIPLIEYAVVFVLALLIWLLASAGGALLAQVRPGAGPEAGPP